MSAGARSFAGACVIFSGLLIAGAGGGIASADVDSSASAGQTQDGGGPSASGGSNNSTADSLNRAVQNAANGVVSAAQGIANTVGSLAGAAQRPGASSHHQSILPRFPLTTFGGTPTAHGSTRPEAVPESTPLTDDDKLPQSAVDPQAAPVDGPAVTPPAITPPAVTPPAVTPPPAHPLAAVTTNIVNPASNVATALTSAVVSVPGVVASLPGSTAPVADIISSLQTTITSVADAAAPLAQVPSDLSALFGLDATPAPTPTQGGAGTDRRPIHTAAAAPSVVVPQTSALSQLLLPTAGGEGVTAPGDVVAATAPLGGQQTLPTDHGESTSAAPAANGDAAGGVLTTVEKVVGAFVASVSVLAVLALALPGVGGLLLTWAVGIRLGYRQAKAAAALPSLAAARFVGSGPIGAVRSGSQVALGSRSARARRSAATQPAPIAGVFPIESGNRVA